jgi:hypothetical protein
MNAKIQRLRAEIGFDRAALERRVQELGSLELGDNADAAACAQAAVALHHAYGSMESILQRVARDVDGDVPSGGDWHQELLHAMGLAIEGIRPAVLSRESVAALRELLSFRHFFRHAYAVELDAERLSILRRHLRRALPRLLTELDRLDGFLADVAEAADGQCR